MKEILDAVDAYIQANLSCPQIRFWGIAELVKKLSSIQPVTVNGSSKRDYIAIDQRYDGITYHRILETNSEDSEDSSFGAVLQKQFNVKVRTILAVKVEKFSEDFIYQFANSIPFQLTISGFDQIYPNSDNSINNDQESIYKTEWGDGDYEKHATPWNIYAIEHTVNFIQC